VRGDRIAGIALAVRIQILLIRVRHGRTVVAGIADAVGVGILLIEVRCVRAVVQVIGKAVAVAVRNQNPASSHQSLVPPVSPIGVSARSILSPTLRFATTARLMPTASTPPTAPVSTRTPLMKRWQLVPSSHAPDLYRRHQMANWPARSLTHRRIAQCSATLLRPFGCASSWLMCVHGAFPAPWSRSQSLPIQYWEPNSMNSVSAS